MDNGNVTSLQKCHILKIWHIARKVMACISLDYMLCIKFGWNWTKICGRSSHLKILTSEILQSAPNGLKLNSKNQTWNVPHICSIYRRQSPILCSFGSMIIRFQEIAHFRIFPLIPMLKFQSATKILIFGRSPKHLLFYPLLWLPYLSYKVWLRSNQHCRRSSVLKFPAQYGPV